MSKQIRIESGKCRSAAIITLAMTLAFVHCVSAYAQAPPLATDIPPDALTKRVEPIYPPIAKAAHITGTVTLEFTITTTGDVADIKVRSGPAMLQQAAIDAVKQWKYRPLLLNDQPHAVRTTAVLNFGFDPSSSDDRKENEVNARVSPFMMKCVDLLNKNDPASLDACRQEVELEKDYPPGRRKMDRLASHDEYGLTLLGFAHDPKAALAQFEMEIDLIPGVLTEENAEYAWAYWHRGVARMQLGNYSGAEKDYTIAERSAALAEQKLPDMAEHYEKTRQKIIAMHIQMLEQLGRHPDAIVLQQQSKP
jgi:TonB family protein